MGGQKGRSGGHNRKPTSVLKEQGGYKKYRHENRIDQHIAVEKPEMPAHLGEIGQKTWKRLMESLPLGVVTKLDLDSLVSYCDLIEAYMTIRPSFLADPIDKNVRHAYMATIQQLDKIGRQFGWSPQSRAGITTTQETKEEDPFEAWLNSDN